VFEHAASSGALRATPMRGGARCCNTSRFPSARNAIP
jgi:hypothetical protein